MYNEIIVEEDNVRKTTLARTNFYYHNPIEAISPLEKVQQTIVKQKHSNGVYSFKVYNIIQLKSKSFPVTSEAYIIIDAIPLRLDVGEVNSESTIDIDELADDVGRAIDNDAFASGIRLSNYGQTVCRLWHPLSKEMEQRIRNASDIRFRFYTESNMITIRLTHDQIDRLKRLIDTPLKNLDID